MILLELTATAAEAEIHKKIPGSGTYGSDITTIIVSNIEMDDVMKIVKSLEVSELLLKGVIKTIENETKRKSGQFLSMLLDTFRACLLGNFL